MGEPRHGAVERGRRRLRDRRVERDVDALGVLQPAGGSGGGAAGSSEGSPRTSDPMSARRIAAIGALLLGFGGFGLAVVVAVQEFPRGLIALACVAVAAAAAWYGILRRGAARVAGLASARSGSRAAIVLLVERPPARGAAGRRRARAGRAPARGRRSPSAPTCRRRRRRSGRSCSSTPSPAAARPSGSRWPPKPARAGSSRSSSAPRGTSSGSCATRSPAAPTGWRWPAATARRPSSPRSPRSSTCPTRASPRAPATTSRSTSASTATTSSARSTRSSTAASAASTSPRSTGACSSTTSRSASTPTRSSATGYRDAKLRTILDTVPDVLGPDGTGLDLRWTGTRRARAPLGRRDPGLQQPLPARPRGRLGHPPEDRRRAARHHRRGRPDRPRRARAPAAATVARVDRAGASRSIPTTPCPPASTARPCKLEPPLRFRIRAGVLRVRIARRHPGASPSAMLPEGLGQSARALARIAAGRDPAPSQPTTKET